MLWSTVKQKDTLEDAVGHLGLAKARKQSISPPHLDTQVVVRIHKAPSFRCRLARLILRHLTPGFQATILYGEVDLIRASS